MTVNHPPIQRKTILRVALMVGMLVFAFTILGVMVYQQWDVLLSYPWRVYPLPLFASFVLYTIDLLLVIWVWGNMMDKVGKPLGFWKHFRYFCIANLAKRLPGTVWYVAGRAEFYKEEGVARRMTSLMSGVEMMVSILSAILVSLFFGLPVLARYQYSLWIIGGLLLGSIGLLHPKVLGYLLHRFGGDHQWIRYRDLILWIGAYGVVWLLGGLLLFLICNILVPTPFHHLDYMIGSWTLVGLLGYVFFFSPSNLGISEVGFSLLLTNIMPPPVAVVVALTIRLLVFLFEIFWAIASMIKQREGSSL